ncbi:hypothetical protein SO802_002566 [Lithocarpus litseifolius]|uniref:Uncharacterized protein n=1 Tax=Lithocarpus litseifolius TaxID=425828 RepID=A0AAW2E071_9ROSI
MLYNFNSYFRIRKPHKFIAFLHFHTCVCGNSGQFNGQEEFRRIKGNINSMGEHAELQSSVRDDISEYKASGSMSPRMQLLRERAAIHGSIAHDCEDTQFHTLYALSLAKGAIDAFEAENTYQNSDIGRVDEAVISDNRMNLIFESPARERLQMFLSSSDLYDPVEVLDLIEGSELWLEKVHWNSYNYFAVGSAY